MSIALVKWQWCDLWILYLHSAVKQFVSDNNKNYSFEAYDEKTHTYVKNECFFLFIFDI